MKSYSPDYIRYGCSVSCFCLNCYHSCSVSQRSLCLVLTVSFLWKSGQTVGSYTSVWGDMTKPFHSSVYPQAFQNWAAIQIHVWSRSFFLKGSVSYPKHRALMPGICFFIREFMIIWDTRQKYQAGQWANYSKDDGGEMYGTLVEVGMTSRVSKILQS